MKKLLIPILLLSFFTGCIKVELLTDKDKVIRPLLGRWHNTYESNSELTNFRRTHVAEFGDSSFALIYRERTVALPDCTLISRYEDITLATYKVDWKFLKLTHMQHEINGVSEYTGKTNYIYFHNIGTSELYLSKAEMWKQLSGNPGQLRDGSFYYYDSITYQSSKKYNHYSLKFMGTDRIEFKYLETDQPEMPSNDADWTIHEFNSQTTDSTFTSDISNRDAIYKFYDGILVSYGVTFPIEIYQGYK